MQNPRMIFRCMSILIFFWANLLFSQTLLNVYELPGETYFNSAYGLTSDSSSIWLSSGSTSAGNAGQLTRFDLSGNQTGTVQTTLGSSQGLTWTGEHFWYFRRATTATSAFVKLLPDGTPVDTILTGTNYVGGLCWDGDGLWYSLYFPNADAALYKMDVTTQTVVDTIQTLGDQPQGIAFDGQFFYYAMDNNDGDTENIYIYDPAKSDTVGLIPIVDPISTSPRGLAWDGNHLWLVADPVGTAQRALFEFEISGGGAGNIDLLTSLLNFGLTEVATVDSVALNVLNIGNGTLTIDNISFDNPLFFIGNDLLPINIPASGNQTVWVYFSPDTAGIQSGTMSIFSNDPAEPEAQLSLTARGMFSNPTIGLIADSHDFGNIWVGQEGIAEWELRVVNEGISTLNIEGFGNSDPAFFLEPTPTIWIISPGDTFKVKVFFSPTEGQVYQDTLTLSSFDVTVASQKIALRGTGISGPFNSGYQYFEYQVPDHPSTSFNEYRPLALKTIADLTGDGVLEIVLCTRNYWTICLDGASADKGIELWRFSSYISNSSAGAIGNTNDLPPQQRALAITNDLNGDGFEDVVIGTGGGNERVYALDGQTGEIIWDFGTDDPNQFGLGDITGVVAVDDFNGDGVNDILATGSATDNGLGGRRTVYIFDGTNGQLLWSRFIGSFLRMAAAIGDVNSNGSYDVVVATGAGVQNTYAIVAYDPVSGASLWNFPIGEPAGGGREVIRYDVPGETADVIAGAYFTAVYRIDGETGNMVWQFSGGFSAVNQIRIIEDLDDDGLDDLLISTFSSNFYCVSGADGSIIWQTLLGDFSWSGHAIRDLTGDGIQDVIVANRNDNLYMLSGADGTIFDSFDMKSDFLQGATLVFPHEDLDNNGSIDILGAADDGRLVAISGGTSALAIDDSPTALPSDYALSQNYPNPFNPGTAFTVSLPERADVRVTVFNMLGQNVAELFNGKLAAGQHEFAFDANQLPSGVYFYRVSANQFVQTRKMLLVR